MSKSKAVEIIDSALEFITKSCDDFADQNLDENRRLKHSTINLSTGIELLLKARLCEEHWTLVVSDPDKYGDNDWETGRFHSVGVQDAIKRIGNILGSSLPIEARNAILDLAKLRNQYIHFVCRGTAEYASAVQLRAWHYALEMLDNRFLTLSPKHLDQVEYARNRMMQHNAFLNARFAEVRDEITMLQEAGATIIECPFCEKRSLRVGDDTKCLVCGDGRTSAEAYAQAYFIGKNPWATSKDYAGEEQVVWCSDCDEQACVPVPEELEANATEAILKDEGIEYEPGMDLEPYFCFNCGAFFEKAEIDECGGCGAQYVNASGDRFCPVCSERWDDE